MVQHVVFLGEQPPYLLNLQVRVAAGQSSAIRASLK